MTSPVPRRLCGTLLHLGTHHAALSHGSFRIEQFLDLASRAPVLVLCHGDVRGEAPLLARVHSSCLTSESLGGCDCDCAGQLDGALAAIARAGRGAVFYLLQEGRGAGLIAKARDRMMVQASQNRVDTFDAYARMGLGRDYRRYDQVGFAAAALGITAPLALLTNNPEKVTALERAGIAVRETLRIERGASPFNLHYLLAKSRSGHALGDPAGQAGAAAALPEPVAYFHPEALPEKPRFLRAATYLLPVRGREPSAGPYWFWLHAYFDLAAGRERVLLTAMNGTGALPLVRVERAPLLARFPTAERAAWRWPVAAAAIAQRGGGAALILTEDTLVPAEAGGNAAVADDADLVWLLAQHVHGPAVQLLIDQPQPSAADTRLCTALAAHRLEVSCAPVS